MLSEVVTQLFERARARFGVDIEILDAPEFRAESIDATVDAYARDCGCDCEA